MNAIWELFDWVLDKLKIIGAACLVGMTLLTCVDVVGRFFGHPVFGSVELVGFMATLAVALALPYTHQVKGHIGVEIVVRLFSERTQAIFDLCTTVFSLALMGIITWRMLIYAGTMKASGEVSMNLELPEYFVIYIVSFCFLIFSLLLVKDIFGYIKQLAGKK